MNDTEIKDRIAGRKDAEDLLALGLEFADTWSTVRLGVFWSTILAAADNAAKIIGIRQTEMRPALVPMSDSEARRFEAEVVPFGKHQSEFVWQVLRDDPGYLDWMVQATEADTFKANLRRFLARADVQEALP